MDIQLIKKQTKKTIRNEKKGGSCCVSSEGE